MRSGARRGVTLVEVLAAVVILSVAATGLAGMSFWAGRSGAQTAMSAARQTVLDAASSQLGALPYRELEAAAGCSEGEESGFDYELCVRVESITEALRRVTVRVAPASELIPADSVVFDRSRSVPTSPF